MKRIITDEAIRHDLEAIKQEIAELETQAAGLESLLKGASSRTTPSGIKPRLRGGTEAYREAIYNTLLSDTPRTTNEIVEMSGVAHSTACRHLRDLERAGLAQETTGNRKRFLRWVRTPVKIKPGEPVQPTLSDE